MITSEHITVFAGSVVAVLLQLLVAPHLAISATPPNVIVAFTLAMAVSRPSAFGCVMPFVLGLAFDLVGGGPVGAMAFSLTAFSVLVARMFPHVDNDSLFMALAMLALGALLVDVSYGLVAVASGIAGSLPETVVHRVLPCFVYDTVVSVVLFLLLRRFVRPAVATRTELTQLR